MNRGMTDDVNIEVNCVDKAIGGVICRQQVSQDTCSFQKNRRFKQPAFSLSE